MHSTEIREAILVGKNPILSRGCLYNDFPSLQKKADNVSLLLL